MRYKIIVLVGYMIIDRSKGIMKVALKWKANYKIPLGENQNKVG